MPKGVHPNHPKGSECGRWNKGRLVSSHGYVKIRVGRAHPFADPNGYAYEHLLVWVAAGNPRPMRHQVMKWRNDDRTDNRIENLFVVTRADHNRMKNAAVRRDPRGRVLSAAASRAILQGAGVRYHYSDQRATDMDGHD